MSTAPPDRANKDAPKIPPAMEHLIARERRYHDYATAPYALPNDSPEHERLNTQAGHISAMMNGNIIHAPMDTILTTGNLLDVGCGTGIATKYMSEHFPKAKCYGLDISDVPSSAQRSDNLVFLKGDILTQKPSQWSAAEKVCPFTEDEALFDYIFSRLLVMGISNWPQYISTAFNLLKPGGYLEIHDLSCDFFDMEHNKISAEWDWSKTLLELCGEKGLDIDAGSKAKDWMAAAGFEDIKATVYRFPFGSNKQTSDEASRFAAFNQVNLPAMLHHAIQRLLAGRVSQERIDEMRGNMWSSFSADVGMYVPFVVTVGRKPLQ